MEKNESWPFSSWPRTVLHSSCFKGACPRPRVWPSSVWALQPCVLNCRRLRPSVSTLVLFSTHVNTTPVPPPTIHSKLLSSIWKDQAALQKRVCSPPARSEKLFLWSSPARHAHQEKMSRRASAAWLESLALTFRHGTNTQFSNCEQGSWYLLQRLEGGAMREYTQST